jgi:hypothetical protein
MEDIELDDDIVAVVIAAIKCMGVREGYRPVIKSIKRTGQNSPVWNTAGRLERIQGKL